MTDNIAESSTRASRPEDDGANGGATGSLSEAEKRANASSPASTAAVTAVLPSAATITASTSPLAPQSAANKQSVATAATTATTATAAATPKRRSCVVCRSRKVRCNKESPCSNCRRAGIPCVVPSADRPPRWARRLERVAHNAAAEERAAQAADSPTAQVMERLRTLESLVKDLSGQLEQAHAAANSSTGNSPASSTQDRDGDHQRLTPLPTGTGSIQSQFGRLVLGDASRSRYVSSGFWSRVNDELDELKMATQHLAEADLDSSEDEELSGTSPSTHELQRTASARHAFLFQHNINSSGPDIRELHPLPSQIPFLLDVFSENVNAAVQIVHMPTVRKMARRSRGSDISRLTPANEALIFSIYYAAITSMEEDDVMNNFGSTKTDLNLKYRLGLEHALARADFLNVPDIVLVQAFAIFLLLVRRHDSPRFVWMMTGLLIRMGQSLGLQRDGTHFKHLTPFEIDIRRRVWYSICALDVRASEDQGTDFTIQYGSFDTKLPWNINDDDIDVDTKETPVERQGITDMTLPILTMETSHISRQMMSPGVSLDEQNHLLATIYARLEERYLRFSSESDGIAYWVMVVVTRLVGAKLTLFTHLPVLFSSPSEHFTDEVRNKLLVAAIEVAEYNDALNEKASQWRWIYQTYTHWHAIVYILIDLCRRPWSPLVDRAWAALHSPWLIPARSKLDTALRTWVPLRKLMLKARKHRETELERLRRDPSAARQVEVDDRSLPIPSTFGPASASAVADSFRERWRMLVGLTGIVEEHTQVEKHPPFPSSESVNSAQVFPVSPNLSANTARSGISSPLIYPPTNHNAMHEPLYEASAAPTTSEAMAIDQQFINAPNHNVFSEPTMNWPDGQPDNGGLLGWFWADADPAVDVFTDVNMDTMDFNVDLEGGMDWYNWVESAKGMEMDAQARTRNPNG
ncbi:hypothetical protein F4859DRAFT_516653 [Xylaria cf. heliscus]|nr:hypothetical protein F4859DRAFT_516653 [Xylaria cf. heliscus]